MPLKAKILNRAFQPQSAKISTSDYSAFDPQPGDDPDDVLFSTVYGVRTIELNRPKKLNSLSASMIRKIIPRLIEYRSSQLASVLIIGGASSRAFCAGGDVSALATEIASHGNQGRARARDYFALEYQLDHLIATYRKPYIAYMDGITMGGGVGLSVHAPIRIATENTLFAMPETGIGFFPDVGGSFFLPRMEGKLGTYLGLTSKTLDGVGAYYAGLATHYIDSAYLGNLTARLAELVFKDYDSLAERLRLIDVTIEEFSSGIPFDKKPVLVGGVRKAIDRCFRFDSVEAIVSALEREKGDVANPAATRAWAQETQDALAEKSPTSLKVTLRQMQLGARWDISETFQREYHIAARFMEHPDFVAGITARLLSKPRRPAEWEPKRVGDVSQDTVDSFFSIEEGSRSLPFEARGGYGAYPFEGILGLPKEEHVKSLVAERGIGKDELVEGLVKGRGGKVGVREKVEEVLERCCSVDADGKVVWEGG
ncbi:MAG: hypothetical protein Q9214_000805 [Letrouitia sp. 1 TL-2023]